MDREVFFARTLEQVRQQAKNQGNCISGEQVREAFRGLGLNEGQLQMVFDYLISHKVGIDSPADPEDYLTDQEKNYLQNYLDQIAGLPALTPGELEALTLSAMAGEAGAAGRLTEAYLGQVADIAKLYTGQGVPLEDLIGEGNLALAAGSRLLSGLKDPEEARGMLARRIMDAMELHIREAEENGRTDQKAAEKVNRVADRARELAEDLRRKVTPDELARETGMSLKSIQEAVRISGYKIEDIEDVQDSV